MTHRFGLLSSLLAPSLLLSLLPGCGGLGAKSDEEPPRCFAEDGFVTEAIPQIVEPGFEFTAEDGCQSWVCLESATGTAWSLVDSSLSEIDGDVSVASDAELAELACVTSISGELLVSDAGTGDITSLTGLGRLDDVGRLTIFENTDLTSLTGLAERGRIAGELRAESNPKLKSIEDLLFWNLGGSVRIIDNDALPNLQGLGDLREASMRPDSVERASGDGGEEPEPIPGEVHGDLELRGNATLADLQGVRGLGVIEGSLILAENEVLDSLLGLGQIYTILADLRITDNPQVPTTSAEAIASVSLVAGETLICGNLDGEACP